MPVPDPGVPVERVRRAVKERVVREIAGLLETSGRVGNPSKLFTDLWNREKRASTAIGGGVAIPHVRTLQAKEMVLAVCLSREGIDFDAPDGAPVHAVIGIVAPPYDDVLYLRVLRQLSTMFLGDEGLVGRVLECGTVDEVIYTLGTAD